MAKRQQKIENYIVRNPKICGGEPVLTGTRITLRTILASLSSGNTIEEILKDYPTLTKPMLQAVIAFAARSAEEDMPLSLIPEIR